MATKGSVRTKRKYTYFDLPAQPGASIPSNGGKVCADVIGYKVFAVRFWHDRLVLSPLHQVVTSNEGRHIGKLRPTDTVAKGYNPNMLASVFPEQTGPSYTIWYKATVGFKMVLDDRLFYSGRYNNFVPYNLLGENDYRELELMTKELDISINDVKVTVRTHSPLTYMTSVPKVKLRTHRKNRKVKVHTGTTIPITRVITMHGFHCYNSFGSLERDLYIDLAADPSKVSLVIGKIRLFGEVVVAQRGYIAEKFEILALYSGGNNNKRRALAHKLGWPGKIEKYQSQSGAPWQI